MKLSIIIVNYNVEYYLEQCLYSVFNALDNVEGEVWVVDNQSVDGSLTMLSRKFPQVHLIANKENLGFSRANNQAIRQSKGEYVLLLNPDTVVETDTFEKCVAFLDATPDAGGLGVKMVNGKGEFLPESKRGLPLPSVAFYKIFGLSKLFPQSKKFGSYHLTYLNNDEIHSVEVLSGAFMMMRKTTLDKVGLLDEDYFMYGEDIDLSYRIIQSGYKNYYFPETRIIHYKGESTKKSSVNYVFVFYHAMQIFAKKHFSQKNAKLFNWLINIAIWFRASLALLVRFFKAILLPLIDFVMVYAGMFVLAQYWEKTVLSLRASHFPDEYLYFFLPLYILIWLFSVAFCGGYQKPIRLSNTNKGIAIGTVVILLIYALLPETYRFSRAVTVFGAMWTVLAMNMIRYLFHKINYKDYAFGSRENRRILVIGSCREAERVVTLVQLVNQKCEFIGIINTEHDHEESEPQQKIQVNCEILGSINQLKDIIAIYKIKEIIFCSKDLPADKIIDLMTELQDIPVEYKIAPQESISIIGSNSINTSDDIYSVHLNAITQKNNQRKKRAFDMIISLLLIIFIIVDVWFVQHKKQYIKNIFSVLSGKKSWVGYQPCQLQNTVKIPDLKAGVLFPTDGLLLHNTSDEMIYKANLVYIRDYHVIHDFRILWKGFDRLGR